LLDVGFSIGDSNDDGVLQYFLYTWDEIPQYDSR